MIYCTFDASFPVTVSPDPPGPTAPSRRGSVSRRVLASVVLVSGLCVAGAGCREKDTIRSYTISKEPLPAEMASDAGHAAHARSVIAYDAPEGWENIRHEEGMRFATLLVEEEENQLEVSIIPLGGGAGGVAANVQRWRGQLGLGQATEDELAEQMFNIEGRDGTPGLLIDMTGPGPEGNTLGDQRMLAAIFIDHGQSWFIKTMGNAEFIGKYRDDFEKLCKTVRFEGGHAEGVGMMGMPDTTASADSEPMTRLPDWTIPEGWEKEAEPRPFSVVSFLVRHEAEEAVMTVSPLSSAPQLLDNVNRWRGQLGLMPIEHLKDTSTPVTISGEQGIMVDLEGEDRRTLGVILPHGGVTWFFKLMGPSGVMAAEKANFESFVQSLHFVEDASGE